MEVKIKSFLNCIGVLYLTCVRLIVPEHSSSSVTPTQLLPSHHPLVIIVVKLEGEGRSTVIDQVISGHDKFATAKKEEGPGHNGSKDEARPDHD